MLLSSRSIMNASAVLLALLCGAIISSFSTTTTTTTTTTSVTAFAPSSVRTSSLSSSSAAVASLWTHQSKLISAKGLVSLDDNQKQRYPHQYRRNSRAGISTTTTGALSMLISPTTEAAVGGLLSDVISSSSSSSSSLITAAVQVFDGSSIVDPVVVSNAFWDGITRQFISLLIGQILAVSVFGLVTTFAKNQIIQLGIFVSDNIFKQQQQQVTGLKKPPPGYTGQLRVEPDFSKLLICIVIDIIGTSSELIPFVGELTDLVWAPIAALLLRNLYGSNVVFALEFAEEFMLFTDALPLACICWVIDTYFAESEAAKVLQLGIYSSKQQEYDSGSADTRNDIWRREEPRTDRGVIDVDVQDIDESGGRGRQLPPDRRT